MNFYRKRTASRSVDQLKTIIAPLQMSPLHRYKRTEAYNRKKEAGNHTFLRDACTSLGENLNYIEKFKEKDHIASTPHA